MDLGRERLENGKENNQERAYESQGVLLLPAGDSHDLGVVIESYRRDGCGEVADGLGWLRVGRERSGISLLEGIRTIDVDQARV